MERLSSALKMGCLGGESGQDSGPKKQWSRPLIVVLNLKISDVKLVGTVINGLSLRVLPISAR